VRGLKLKEIENENRARGLSHPTRVRGLKPKLNEFAAWIIAVAPYAGAWIETPKMIIDLPGRIVAPYAGAWIETD